VVNVNERPDGKYLKQLHLLGSLVQVKLNHKYFKTNALLNTLKMSRKEDLGAFFALLIITGLLGSVIMLALGIICLGSHHDWCPSTAGSTVMTIAGSGVILGLIGFGIIFGD
jgi:hypothetical protein